MKKFIYIFIILFVAVGCSDEETSYDNQAEEIELNLYTFEELHETVWEDSEEVFNILVKKLDDNYNFSQEDHDKIKNYFNRYIDSNYKNMEGAEYSLVTNIFTFDLNMMIRHGGDKEQQKERAKRVEKQYMELEQLFKERNKLN